MNTQSFINVKYKDLLAVAALNGKSIYENEFNRLSNLPFIRDSIIHNVEAMINCRDLSKGHIFLECDNCDNYHLIGPSCKSRFCASCGHKYRDARSIEIQNKLINVNHRHFVFSVPFLLRPLFWKCRELFDCLFKTVNEALHFSIKLSKKDKKADFRLGFVSFLHTSGKSLNLHPHLHVLLAEALVDKHGNYKKIDFFPFERLRKVFMYKFLSNANKVLKNYGNSKPYSDFNRLRTLIVREYKNGFYTYGPKSNEFISEKNKLNSIKKIADYISRYASHPPIAESNILNFDKDKNLVTWKYLDYQTNKDVTVIESSFKFIGKLIRHILDKGFHQIRYYGFYSNKTNKIKNITKLLHHNYIKHLKHKLKWRIMLLETFRFDPGLCYFGGKFIVNYDFSLLPTKERNFISDG